MRIAFLDLDFDFVRYSGSWNTRYRLTWNLNTCNFCECVLRMLYKTPESFISAVTRHDWHDYTIWSINLKMYVHRGYRIRTACI